MSARALDEFVRERFGALQWDLVVVSAELDRLRDRIAALEAENAALTAKQPKATR